jgi:TPR repeat protein
MQLSTRYLPAPRVLAMLALLGLAAIAIPALGLHQPDLSRLSAAEIDRLRLTAQTVPHALAQIHLAADQGNRPAQRVTASLYLQKSDPDSWQTGIEYARRAAIGGDPEAFFLLGQVYFNGRATLTQMPDYGRARHWFELAAEHGSNQAEYLLGQIYQNGYGIAPDQERASYWFELAASHGNADAMLMLGGNRHLRLATQT